MTELFEKIHSMMETNRRPREIQYRMYTQLRRDLSIKDERRWQGRQEEMTAMYDIHDGRLGTRMHITSEWSHIPRQGL